MTGKIGCGEGVQCDSCPAHCSVYRRANGPGSEDLGWRAVEEAVGEDDHDPTHLGLAPVPLRAHDLVGMVAIVVLAVLLVRGCSPLLYSLTVLSVRTHPPMVFLVIMLRRSSCHGCMN